MSVTSRTRSLNTRWTFTSVNLFLKKKNFKGDQCEKSRLTCNYFIPSPSTWPIKSQEEQLKESHVCVHLFRRLLGHYYCIKAVEHLLKDLQECQCSESINVLRPKSFKIELLQGFQPSLDLTQSKDKQTKPKWVTSLLIPGWQLTLFIQQNMISQDSHFFFLNEKTTT